MHVNLRVIARRNRFAALLLAPLVLAGCGRPPASSVACGCAAAGGPAPGSEQDLVANIGDRVFFAFNSSTLTADGCSKIKGPDALTKTWPNNPECHSSMSAVTTLNCQAAWLAKYPDVNILITGNTDERGTETYNLALASAAPMQRAIISSHKALRQAA